VKQMKTNMTGMGLFTVFRRFRFADPKTLMDWIHEKRVYKDFTYLFVGPMMTVLAVDPDAAKFVLKCPQIKKSPGVIDTSTKMGKFLSENVLSQDGEIWRRQRTFMNHGFQAEALSRYYPSFLELTEKAISKFPVNEDMEISSFFSRFTLDILGKAIFNHDFGRIEGKNDQYYSAYQQILRTFVSPLVFFALVWPKVPLKVNRDLNEGIDTIIQFFSEMIAQHQGKHDSSVLSHLLAGVESTEGPSLTQQELISNIWTLFIAGHETTSGALTWACNCLRAYPEIQEKLFNEIQSKIGLDKVPTEEDLIQLTYLDCFINEVLRLHSPVFFLTTREATEDIKYKDQIIPKGAAVGILFPALQTNPEYWEDPETFNPDRFLPENKKGRHHFVHIPFSAGIRQCIGTNFSMTEQRLFLTRLLQQYRIVEPREKASFPTTKFLKFGEKNEVNIRLEKR